MASDIDLKIDAVFSLADKERKDEGDSTLNKDETCSSKVVQEENALDKNASLFLDASEGTLSVDYSDPYQNEFGDAEDLLPDADDIDENPDVVSGMTSLNSIVIDSSNGDFSKPDKTDTTHARTDVTRSQDPDAPPALLLEGSNMAGTPYFKLDEQSEYMPPPVLQPVEPLVSGTVRKKRKCQKIAPSYIVLTKADQVLGSTTTISSRKFKRELVECSNMCKKTHFRRQLEAGKDVFNVMVPSKQKYLYNYLVQIEKERAIRTRKKVVQFPHLKYLLEKHQKTTLKRKQSSDRKGLCRIQRTVTLVPKDFALRPESPSVTEEEPVQNKETFSAEELAAFQKRQAARKLRLELTSLKKLIAIKRSFNRQNKRYRKTKKDGLKQFLQADVTSSVSGRVRRENRRYEGDFVVSKEEIDQTLLEYRVQAKLRKAENENKKKEKYFQKANQKFEESRKRQLECASDAKKRKFADVVIDNPEEGQEKEFHRRKTKTNAVTAKTLAKFINNRHSRHTSRVKNTENRERREKLPNRDGVLIQDLPEEQSVISRLFQSSTHSEPTSSSAAGVTQGYTVVSLGPEPHVDPYARARQMLKDSLAKSQTPSKEPLPVPLSKIKVEPGTEPSEPPGNSLLDQEKFKRFKIPENVQRLFVKKEPGVEGESTQASKSTASMVPVIKPKPSTAPNVVPSVIAVTVTYTNGSSKKVLLASSPLFSSPGQGSSPVFIKTPDGAKFVLTPTVSRPSVVPTTAQVVRISPAVTSSQYTYTLLEPRVSYSHSKLSAPKTVVASASTPLPSSSVTAVPHVSPKAIPTTVAPPNLGLIPSVVQLPVGSVQSRITQDKQLQGPVNLEPADKPWKQLLASSSTSGPAELGKNVVRTVYPAAMSTKVQSKPAALVVHTSETKTSVIKASGAVANTSTVVLKEPKDTGTVENLLQKSIDKGRFYLLKIDGKNVLIPIEGDKAQPKAYVVSSEVLVSNTQTDRTYVTVPANQSKGTTTTWSNPTVIGKLDNVPVVKPAQAAMKQLESVFVQTTTTKPNSLVQLVPAVAGNAISQGALMNYTTVVAKTTSIQPTKVQTVLDARSSYLKQSNAIVSQVQPNVCAAQPGAPQIIIPSSGQTPAQIIIPNYKFITNNKTQNLYPIYLHQPTISAGNILATQTLASVTSAANSKISGFLPTITPALNGRDSQKVALLSKASVSQKSPSSIIKENVSKSVINSDGVASDVNNLNKTAGSAEKLTGSDEHAVKSEILTEKSEDKQAENPKAFLEGITAREEKLRRLKELLKEKQMAVEAIRGSKTKMEDTAADD